MVIGSLGAGYSSVFSIRGTTESDMAGPADLHIHTTASDGTSTLGQRISQAVERELNVVSITDHDRITSDLSERVHRRDDILLVTGVEVRADLFGSKIELLGYFVDPAAETLDDILSTARRYRRRRNRALAERLTDETGLTVDHEDLGDTAGGMLGRPHFANHLVEHGVVDSVGAAFEEYLGPGGDAYVPMERLAHERVIDAIHDADGLVSLAHPGRIRSEQIPEMVATLADAGLDAIEVWYPYGSEPNVTVEDAAELAEEHDLLKTGGSDCHGPGSGKFRIGDVRVPGAEFDDLLRAAGLADTVGRFE